MSFQWLPRLNPLVSQSRSIRTRACRNLAGAAINGIQSQVLDLGLAYRPIETMRRVSSIVGRGIDPADCRCGHARKSCALASAIFSSSNADGRETRGLLRGYLPLINSTSSDELRRQAGERMVAAVSREIRTQLSTGGLSLESVGGPARFPLPALIECVGVRPGSRTLLETLAHDSSLITGGQQLGQRIVDELIVDLMVDDSESVQDFGLRLMLTHYAESVSAAIQRRHGWVGDRAVQAVLQEVSFDFYNEVHRFDVRRQSVVRRLLVLSEDVLRRWDAI